MCWVMPPRSPAATSVVRIASSRLVLPWSTWPMTVTIGARGDEVGRVVLLEEDLLGGRCGWGPLLLALDGHAGGRGDRLGDFVAELAGDERRGVAVDQLVDGREDAALDQLADHVRRVDREELGQLLDGDRRRQLDRAALARVDRLHLRIRVAGTPRRLARSAPAAGAAPTPGHGLLLSLSSSSPVRPGAPLGAPAERRPRSARPRAPRSAAIVQQPASRQRYAPRPASRPVSSMVIRPSGVRTTRTSSRFGRAVRQATHDRVGTRRRRIRSRPAYDPTSSVGTVFLVRAFFAGAATARLRRRRRARRSRPS